MAGFAICVAGGLACFMIAFFVGLPLLVIKPSKFATSFTLGSILFMARYFHTHTGLQTGHYILARMLAAKSVAWCR